MDKESIRTILKSVKYPGFSRDIVSFGLVQDIQVDSDRVVVSLSLTTGDPKVPGAIKHAVEDAVGKMDGVRSVECQVAVQPPKSPVSADGGQQTLQQIPGVKKIIAVASGKGGVGKSTVAVNLACAFNQILDAAGPHDGVGILDCDIYGPSVPQMMGLNLRPEIEDDQMIPPTNFGIKVMSIGLLIDESAPVVWRGPMINNAISQFARHVKWGPLEVLVVDLPPGTGDAQLSLVQTFPLDGVIIVTTPQTVAVNVTRRGARMFGKVAVPVLGVCENMSYLELPDGQRMHIFGQDGGQQTADDLKVPLLGQIPLDSDIREGGDRGLPICVSYPDRASSIAFRKIAETVWNGLQ